MSSSVISIKDTELERKFLKQSACIGILLGILVWSLQVNVTVDRLGCSNIQRSPQGRQDGSGSYPATVSTR